MCLKTKDEQYESKPNYMIVPAAIKELEKIGMLRGFDNVYRQDHAVAEAQNKYRSTKGDMPT